MIVVKGSSSFVPKGPASVTIGNFDGVHIGHQELLRRTVARAKTSGSQSVALTFSPHPVRFFSPNARFYEITSLDEKAAIIAGYGIDVLVVETFTGQVGGMLPAEFAREIIAGRLRAGHVVVGYDFTFGAKRTGTPKELELLGRELGFEVEVVPPLVRGGTIVSSTRIRDLLLAGRVREAEELMRRPYMLSGPVITGAGRGKKLGFPTANIQFSQEIVPLPGVYVVDAEVEGVSRRSVANVGFNPTFGENSLGVEVHLLDFEGDLYGKRVTVRFRDRIRDERKFKSAADLVRQIEKDVRYAREMKLREPSSGSGDGRNRAAAGGSGS